MKKAIIILSRERLAKLFRALAEGLSKDYRVIVLINTMPHFDESHEWKSPQGFEVIDFFSEIRKSFAGPQGVPTPQEITQIEKEINLPLYKAASNYLLYRRICRDYHIPWTPKKFYADEKELVDEFVGSYRVLKKMIDQYKPHSFFMETVDLISTLVALGLSQKKQIYCLGLGNPPVLGDGTVYINCGLRRRSPLLEFLYKNPQHLTKENLKTAELLIDRFESGQWTAMSQIERFKSDTSSLKGHLKNAKKVWRKDSLLHPEKPIIRAVDRIWLERNLSREMPNKPYILFFMHHQPEASLCSWAPRWIDQERILEQLAVNAPHGITIAVKENPRTFGQRGKAYFRKLLELPNIKLCHPSLSSSELSKNAEILFTVTGSLGIEGIIAGKKVAVLSDGYYAIKKDLRILKYPEELFEVMKDPNWHPEKDREDRRNFVASYAQACDNWGPITPGQKWPPLREGGSRMAGIFKKYLGNLEKYGIRPEHCHTGLEMS